MDLPISWTKMMNITNNKQLHTSQISSFKKYTGINADNIENKNIREQVDKVIPSNVVMDLISFMLALRIHYYYFL